VVLLSRADGHAVVASSAALQAAGVDAATAAPSGGEILKGPDGQPTGLLVDAAEQLVARLAPQADPAALREAYRAGFRVEAAYGWTGVHFMSAPWKDIPLLEDMAEDGEAPLRIYNSVTPDGAAELIAGGPRSVADGRIITRAVKYYADGALGSRGAALFEPYADRSDTTGLMQITEQEIVPLYEAALKGGIQIATHAIGDRGNASVAEWYQQALAAVPAGQRPNGADVRWRIEHAQILRPADYHWFKDLPIIASMQPSHAIGDFHFAPARLGDARLDGAYAWRSLVDLGVIVVGGSDAPVERGAPLIEFYAAVARRDLEGFQGPDWRPNEAVDRATALKMFTLWPAYASFREDELGTIEVGKRADFTAFNIDLMTVREADIPRGHAVLTVVDGVVVYRAD
jgi:predicted amidohydrolase YtcJ